MGKQNDNNLRARLLTEGLCTSLLIEKYCESCGTVNPDTDQEDKLDKDIPWMIFGQDDPLLCFLSMDKSKSGQFVRIWALFGPEGAPKAPNVWYHPLTSWSHTDYGRG